MNKILIIDDEASIIESLKTLLLRENYQIYSAFDGEEAIRKVTEIKPDLILLDLVLPKIGGIQVCRKIKSNPATQNIPIIIITGRDGIEERIEGLKSGANDFLTKPLETTELLLRIRSLLELKSSQEKLIQSYNEISHNQKLKEELMHMK